jgi:hypothetical protein
LSARALVEGTYLNAFSVLNKANVDPAALMLGEILSLLDLSPVIQGAILFTPF